MRLTVKHTIILCLSLTSCIEGIEEGDKRRARESWNDECNDYAILLGTTAGSPSYTNCRNKRHKMRVQVATNPTSEEVAALVFCECIKP